MTNPLIARIVRLPRRAAGRILRGVKKALRPPQKVPPIWEGVYEHITDVPCWGVGHDSAAWSEALVKDFKHVRAGHSWLDFDLEHEILFLLVQWVRDRGTRVEVLDFGGGVGSAFALALHRFPSSLNIHYHVIEVDSVAKQGALLFNDEPRITFSTDLSAVDAVPHILLAKGVLQYVEDYSALLDRLFSIHAPFVLFEKFSGVACPTYATAQRNILDSSIPHWFISFDDVFTRAKKWGYERVLWRRLPRIYDQANFPPERRMNQASTLLFGNGKR